jgi:inner membrane protein
MSPEWITLIWLISGVAMIASEVVVPGFFIAFVGMAAMMIAGMRWLTGLEHLGVSLLLWGMLSAALVISFRRVALRWVGKGERRTAYVDDRGDCDDLGALVEVVKAVGEGDSEGRIRYQGTTWPATTLRGRIAAGQQAKLVTRENLVWLIEPADLERISDDPLEESFAALAREEDEEVEVQARRSARPKHLNG